MGSITKKCSEKSSKSIPMIIFNNCNELELLLGDWLNNGKSSYDNMGLLMYKLGIICDENSIIEICNYSIKDNSFYCLIDDGRIYQIRFKNLNIKGFNTEIEVSICNEKFIYECIPMNMIELGMRVLKKSYSIYKDGITYTRCFSIDNVVFIVDNGKYALEFGVSKPKDVVLSLFDGKGNYSKYELENEDRLVKYLTSLKYPISIMDVYNDICRISLGAVSEYPRLLLKIYKRNFNTSDKVTDLIHLEYGRLQNFGISYDDKTIMIDKNDNWFYEIVNGDTIVGVSLDMNTNRINYNVNLSSFLDFNDIRCNMFDVNRDISDTKVLVKKVFDKNMNSN